MQQQSTFNFGLTKIFFGFTAHSVCGKKPKTIEIEIRGQMLNFFLFCFVPKSPTQMGSLSAKNASKKFSRLGTFNIG